MIAEKVGHFLDLKRIKRWGGMGGLAVLDQGLFSGASFLVNILLARWLAPDEYGAFAVALSVFYLLAGFHTAVLTEPMIVFGAGKYREKFQKYLGMLLYGHWGISAVIALLLGVAAYVMGSMGSPAMAQALAGLAVSSPLLLLLWLVRRGCYVHLRPLWAVVASGVNLAVTLAGLFLFWHAGLLSSLSGLAVLGAAAGTASLALLLFPLRPRLWGFTGYPTPPMVLSDHWSYGRWSGATMILMWVPGNVYFALLPVTNGLEGSASLRALHNVVLPILHALSAVSLLLMPFFSEAAHRREAVFHRQVATVLMLFLLVSVLYWTFLVVGSREITGLLYGEKYAKDAQLLALLGLLPVSASVVTVIGGALRAMERPDQVFFSYVASTLSAVTFGVPLTVHAGLSGAVLGQLVGSLTTAAAMMWFYFGGNKPRRAV